MKKILFLLSFTLVIFSCGSSTNSTTDHAPDLECLDRPDGIPAEMCSGDPIEWDCMMQEAWLNDRLSFHYSDSGCVDAIIKKSPGGTETGNHTEVSPDQIRVGLEKNENR